MNDLKFSELKNLFPGLNLSQPNFILLVIDVLLIYTQIFFGIYLCFKFSGFILLIGVLLIGSGQHGLALLAHEGAHSLLSVNRRINDFFARWFFASPILLPYDLYRSRHFQHHRFVSTDLDTKELYRENIEGKEVFYSIIRSLFFYDYIKQVLIVINRNALAKTEKISYFYDYFSISIVQVLIASIFSLLFGFQYYLLFG